MARGRARMAPTQWQRRAHTGARLTWAWRGLLVGPLVVLIVGVVLAWWGSRNPVSGLSSGLLTAVSGLLAVETFLATLGLTFGRGDAYRRAVDALTAEHDRLEELSAVGGSVALGNLYLQVAFPISVRADLLQDALDPTSRPRITLRGDELALADAVDRRRKRGWRLQEDPDDLQWVRGVLSHTRASEARIALICYLAAGVVGVAMLAGGSAGWHWTIHPAPEFFALLALSAAALCVCAMSLLARNESMNEIRDQLSLDRLPVVKMAIQIHPWRMNQETAEVQVTRAPKNRFALILLAAALIADPAAGQREEEQGLLAPFNIWKLDEWNRARVEAARTLLAKLVTQRPPTSSQPGTWRWRSPDVSAALLRARVGELLGEDPEALIGLSSQVAAKMALDIPLAGGSNAWGPFAGRTYLLPTGWTADSYGTPSPA